MISRRVLIMDMKWHFLWERSLLILALKKLRFVFSYWLLWPFLTPMPIQLRSPHCCLVCSANLRIYIESDLLPISCHPGYPGKCHNLEQVQPDQRQRRHKDVTTWATWCGIARDSVASRDELSQRKDKKMGERLLQVLTSSISGVTFTRWTL